MVCIDTRLWVPKTDPRLLSGIMPLVVRSNGEVRRREELEKHYLLLSSEPSCLLTSMMDAIAVVVLEVVFKSSAQMSSTENNDPIQAFVANAAIEPFRICVRSRAVVRCDHFFDVHVLYSSLEVGSKYRVTISK